MDTSSQAAPADDLDDLDDLEPPERIGVRVQESTATRELTVPLDPGMGPNELIAVLDRYVHPNLRLVEPVTLTFGPPQ